MDPNATLRELESLLTGKTTPRKYGPAHRIRELVENLEAWFSGGGFEPDWLAYPRATKWFQSTHRRTFQAIVAATAGSDSPATGEVCRFFASKGEAVAWVIDAMKSWSAGPGRVEDLTRGALGDRHGQGFRWVRGDEDHDLMAITDY